MVKHKINLINKKVSFVVILLFAFVGVTILAYSFASYNAVSIEPEKGQPSSVPLAIPDSNASGGFAVKFSSQSSNMLDNFFPIGTFISPDYDFGKWRNRGVNTIVEPPQGTDPSPWATKAYQSGLKVIAPQNAGSQPGVIAWNHPDEPDGIYSQRPYSEIQQNYAKWKAINPNMPVYINFIGKLNQYDLKTGEGGKTLYQKYIEGADWISGDVYPINEGFNINEVGKMVDTLRDYSGNKPVFAFIESSDYNTSNSFPGPNPAELRAQIWSSIIHGVRGYWYFAPRVVPNFLFDATPSDVAEEMTRQNNLVTSLTAVLQQGAINPSDMGAIVPAGLEVGWRNHSTGKYFFVLNLTNTTKSNQTITFNGVGTATSVTVYQENRSIPVTNGKIIDNFDPYQVHIYKVQ